MNTEAAQRLDRIRQLWQALARLPDSAERTREYRRLMKAIRAEVEQWKRVTGKP